MIIHIIYQYILHTTTHNHIFILILRPPIDAKQAKTQINTYLTSPTKGVHLFLPTSTSSTSYVISFSSKQTPHLKNTHINNSIVTNILIIYIPSSFIHLNLLSTWWQAWQRFGLCIKKKVAWDDTDKPPTVSGSHIRIPRACTHRAQRCSGGHLQCDCEIWLTARLEVCTCCRCCCCWLMVKQLFMCIPNDEQVRSLVKR